MFTTDDAAEQIARPNQCQRFVSTVPENYDRSLAQLEHVSRHWSVTSSLGGSAIRMKKCFSILLTAVVVMGCSTQPLSRSDASSLQNQPPSHENLAGGYVHGTRKLYLTLRKNGTYSAGLGDCQGMDGIAVGTWSIVGEQVVFSSTNETKQIKGLLKSAAIVKDRQNWALVRPEDRKLVKSRGISFETCLKNTAVLK